MSRLSMKDGRIVLDDQSEKPKSTTQKTSANDSRLSMVDGRIVLADRAPVNTAKNQSYLQRTQKAQQEYLAMDDYTPQRRSSNVMEMAINSLRNRLANSTAGNATREWASRMSNTYHTIANETPVERARRQQARVDRAALIDQVSPAEEARNEARRQQWAIDNAQLIDQASSMYEGPTRTERVRGRNYDTTGADMFSNDWEPGAMQEYDYLRTVRNERYNPLSREDRDDLINRYADAVNGNVDANTYQQILYDVTKNGGIEQLYREQQSDAANDREYGRQLRGVDLDSMSFLQRVGGTLGGVAAASGEQIASSGLGLVASGLNREASIATQEYGPALEQTARRWFYGLVNGADDPSVEEQIRTVASYAGVDGDALINRIRDRAEQAKNSDEDVAVFAYGLLDGIEADQDKIWENAQQAISEAGFYDAINKLQQKASENIQYAKDVNKLQDFLGSNFADNVVEAGVSTIQNAADAAMAAALGLSGTGVVAMIPFALRAYGGSYAEQMQQATELGGMIGQDVAKRAATSAGMSSAIEVGTEMMWGMVGAMSKVTGGGALDDAAQERLTEVLSGWAKTEKGRKVLTFIGEKALGGVTEGLEEVIGDAAEQMLKNAGIMPGEADEFSEWVKNAGHSFVTGALGGLLGETTSIVMSPMQKANIGQQVRNGTLDVNLNDLVDMANAEGMENSALAKTYSELFKGMPRSVESLSNYEVGKLYDAYGETITRSDEAIERLREMVAKVESGEELKRSDVNKITNNPEVVQQLQEAAGGELNLGGNINERRAAVEMALRTFANGAESANQAQAENVQAAIENASTPILQRQMDYNAMMAAAQGIRQNTAAEDIRNSLRTEQSLRDNVISSARSVYNAAERLGASDQAQDVMAQMYSPGQNTIDYAGKMTSIYNRAKAGDSLDVSNLDGITMQQAQAVHNVGRMEFLQEEAKNGEESGLRVRSGVQGNDSQSAGGQSQRVEEAPGSVELREGTAGFERRRPVSGVYSQPVSAASLGIRGGSENRNIRVLTNSNDKAVQRAQQLIESRGYKAVLFTGGALEINGEQARGYYDPETNTIYVRADHRLFTAEQIAQHEVMHDRIRNGEVDLSAVKDDMIKRLGGTERFERTMRDYYALYENTGMSLAQIFEEAVCDAAGNMNEFLYHGHWNDANAAVSFYKTAKESAKTTAKEGGEQKAAEQKMSREVPAGAYLPRTSSEERSRYDGSDSAYAIDPNGRKYSLDSLGKDIIDRKFQSDLVNKLGMDPDYVKKLVASLNDLMDYIKPNRDILDLNETYTKENRPYSPYKPNSDPLYKISLDYSTLCRKRLMTQYIIEKLQLREHRPMSGEEQIAIRDMLKEYRQRESGLQVACAMCYVEAARLKSPDQMNRYFEDPTPVLKNYFAQKNKAYKRKVENLQKKWKTDHGYAADATKDQMKKDKRGNGNTDVEALNEYSKQIRQQYDPAKDQADAKRRKAELDAIERAKTLSPDNYLSAANLADLKENDQLIYDAYTSNIRSATRSKGLETDVPYYYGDSRRKGGPSDKFIKNVNAENGMRFSSWSDFQFVHLLDQMVATIDLAVRKAAMHGYTKFPEQVRIFGKTGAMFNMSGVSGGTGFNADGSLYFSPTESIDFEEAKRLREEFPETAGLQCIGINDKHVRALLQSDFIDYVIPYHVSGMNAALRNMAKISSWKDYTSTQEESVIDSSAKWEDSEKKCPKDKWHKAPVFSEFFNPAWYTDPVYKGKGVEAMREAKKRYVQLCADRGMRPKFPQFLNEANYWKLLIDRKMVNQKTGDLIQQKPVMPNFDFDVIKKEIDTYVANTRATQGIEDRALKYITDRWDQLPGRIAALKQEGAVEKTIAEVEHRANTLGNEMYAAAPKNVAAYKYSMDLEADRKEMREQIRAALQGRWNRYESVYIANTSELLQGVGLKDYPIYMTAGHLRNAVKPKNPKKHQHGLSETTLQRIDESLTRPVIVYESESKPGEIVVVTDLKDSDEVNVAVIIRPDGTAHVNNAEIASNYGKSAYGPDNLTRKIERAVSSGRFLYGNKTKIRQISRSAALQLRGALDSGGFAIANIAQFQSHRQEDLLVSEGDFAKARASRDIDTSGYTEKQMKNYEYNQKQNTVGDTLKTLGGSDIKRSKYGVGKDIGGRIYMHRDYADSVIPEDVYESAKQALAEAYPDFDYNCVEWSEKDGVVRFDEAPGFDTEREPIVGDYVTVNPDGTTKKGHTDYIWHHKWLWVKDDYKGFNVSDSWNWSKRWLSTISGKTYDVNGKEYNDRGKSDGNGIGRWNAQLDAYGLPRDSGGKLSIDFETDTAPVHQAHTSRGTSINTTKLPVLYKLADAKGGFKNGTVNIDIGAGVEGTPATAYLAERGVNSLPFDPFNRNRETNMAVMDFLKSGKKADTATCSNVLNVIDNEQARANVILQMAKAIKPDGTAYFTVYSDEKRLEAGKAGEVSSKPDQWQELRAAKTYVPEIKKYFDDVPDPKSGLIIARKPKANLPKATWQIASTEYTDKEGNKPYSKDEAVRFSRDLDSDGNKLSEQQAEYFKDSKVRDAEGNLMVLYHGTNTPGFTVFDPAKSDDKTSLFFTSNPRMANTYTRLQTDGRDLDVFNLITEDSSAEDFNKAAKKNGSSFRVIKITPEWLDKRRGQYVSAIDELRPYISDLIKSIDGMGDYLSAWQRTALQKMQNGGNSRDTLDTIRNILWNGGQYLGYRTKEQRAAHKRFSEIERIIRPILDKASRYGIANEVPDSAVGKYIYEAEKPFKDVEYEIGTRERGFSGGPAYGTEKEAIEKVLSRIYYLPEHTLGNRYKVYLNITNPFVIEGGKKIEGDYNVSAYLDYEGDVTFSFIDKETGELVWESIVRESDAAEEQTKELIGNDAFARFDTMLQENEGDPGRYELGSTYVNTVAPGSWNNLTLNGEMGKKTRDVVKWAKEQGHDGVIFNNIKDTGGWSGGFDPGHGTVVVAFDSNQVKSVDNKTPTENPDIRFSRELKSEAKRAAGEKLTENQFYSLYSAHKLDMRKQGNIDEQIQKIRSEGFKGTGGFTGNVMPTNLSYNYRDGKPVPANVSVDRYAPRKGDRIMFVPRSGINSATDSVKLGYRPMFDYEIVTADYDYQPYYEMYSKAYDQAKESNAEIRYSRDLAPVFYSKLEREIEKYKGDKIGAASAISYLKGKGVKDEDIKWSGINTFLEGKKSVDKAELLEYIKSNRIKVEEVTLDNTESKYYVGPNGERVNAYSHFDPVRDTEYESKDDFKADAIRLAENDKYSKEDITFTFDDEHEYWSAEVDGDLILEAYPPDPYDLMDSDMRGEFDTIWDNYTLDGGSNYREILFTLPDSDYINAAMRTHWRRPGVLAHARIQDFESNGLPVLFVDEIQSDWHNEGAKSGYGEEDEIRKKERIKKERRAANDAYDEALKNATSVMQKLVYNPAGYDFSDFEATERTRDDVKYFSYATKEEATEWLRGIYEKEGISKEAIVKATDALYEAHKKAEERQSVLARTNAEAHQHPVKDAPFKNNYTDFVLKDLLRKAAEGNYDYLAWTPGWMQEERWSKKYAKGYQIEYDQDIPAFLKKYGKQWGANVSRISLDHHYGFQVPAIEITDAMKQSVLYEGQPMFSRDLSNTELYDANRQLQKDLTELRSKLKTRTEQYKYWKGQTKVTEGRKLRIEDVTKLAREIIKGQESNADAKLIAQSMKELGEYLLNSQDEDVYEEARMKAYAIAHDILSQAKVLNTKGGEDFYKDFRSLLKGYNIYVAPSVREELAPYGWNDFRKSLFGTVNMTADQNKGTSIDQVYTDLQKQFGDWLLPEYIANEADQLNRILEVIETYRPVYENLNSYDMADAVEWTANEILTRIIGNEIRETNPTYADRMEKKLADQKMKTQDALRKVRENRDQKVQNLKEHYQQMAEDRRNRKIDSEARTRLLNIAKRLNNKKLPRVTRALLDQYIGDLDLVSKGIMGWKVKELETLQAWYDSYKASMGEDFIPDRFIEKKIERLSKKHISDLTQEEVADLTTVLLNIENMIRTENELIESKIKMDTYAAGVQTIDDINNSNGKTGFLNKYISTETATPEREVHRITGYRENSPLYMAAKELSDGQRKMLDYQRRAEALFKKWTTDKAFIKRIAGKKAEAITVQGIVDGKTTNVVITPAMRMALYLHSKNDDNMRHIAKGGVKIPNMSLYAKGKLQEAYDKATRVVFTRGMINEIASHMTDKERAFADAVDAYYNGMSRDSLNDVSELLRGYAIAGVEHYYPIDTDGSFLKKEFDAIKRDGSIEGMGMLKERIEGASNPIMLYDINDTLNRSISQHSKYYGLAIPVRNFNRLYGVTTMTTTGYGTSVAETLKKNWGSDATKYIEKMMADVQNGTGLKSDAWGDLLARARSHYAKAVLNTNASVAMKQAASYPTAAAVVGYGPLMKALADTKKIDLNKLAEYTPLLWYRSKGFSTTELGDIGKEGGHIPKALNWIQAIDVATTTKLAKAAMYYVNENNNLTRGTDAWWKAVAEVYNRIIEETQPNYTMMQRPQILRSDNALTRALNMFKTQPFQNFNILYDAFGNLAAKTRENKANPTQENENALKQARTGVARAVSSQLVSAFEFAFMQFLWDAFRGKAKKYKDDDDEMTLASWLKGMGINVLSSVGGMIPFGSYALELGEALTDAILKGFKKGPFFDQTFYGLSENAAESMNDMGNALLSIVNKVSKALQGEATTESTIRSLVDSMGDIAQFAGIPVNNVIKLAQSLARNVFLATDGKYLGGFEALRVTTDPSKYKSDYYDVLKKAWLNDPKAFEEIRKRMIDMAGDPFATSSKTAEENIDAKIKEWKKEKAPTEAFYQNTMNAMQTSNLWNMATSAQKEKATDNLLALTIGDEKMTETVEGGKAVGLDATEYMLYKLALQMADEDGNGSIKQSEAEAAANMIPGLSNEEKAYLFQSTNKSWKNNPFEVTRGGNFADLTLNQLSRVPNIFGYGSDVFKTGTGLYNGYGVSQTGKLSAKRKELESSVGADFYRSIYLTAAQSEGKTGTNDRIEQIINERAADFTGGQFELNAYDRMVATLAQLRGDALVSGETDAAEYYGSLLESLDNMDEEQRNKLTESLRSLGF